MKLHLGIDIGGTNVKFGIIDSDYILKHSESTKLPRDLSREELFDWLTLQINIQLKKFHKIVNIGLGFPGVINSSGKVIVAPNIPEFSGFELKKSLETFFKRKINIDNDANLAAIAELVCGNGKGLKNFVYITLGTGVGGAIIINEKIYRGTNFGAGEIGHIIINPFDEINVDVPFRTGVLEEYLGKEAIIRTAKNLSKKFEKSPIVKESLWDVAHISDYADKGESLAVETMKISGYYLGLAIVSVANLLDIQDFVIGGGISKSSDIFYESALDTAMKRTLPQMSDKISIKKAKFVEKSGIIGSAIFGMRTY